MVFAVGPSAYFRVLSSGSIYVVLAKLFPDVLLLVFYSFSIYLCI